MARVRGQEPDPIDVQVGERIRARRKVLGLSQQQLASLVEVSFQQIQKYERGGNRTSASMLCHIATALECTPNDLLPAFSSEGGTRPAAVNAAYKVMTRPYGATLIIALARIPEWAYEAAQKLVTSLDLATKD